MIRSALLAATAALWLVPSSAHATLHYFVIDLNGANEVTAGGVPNQGDPDGSGTANLIIDDVALSISWNISVVDIALPPIGAHIHNAASNTTGPIRIDFNSQLSGSGLVDADLAGLLANPTQWYVNVHNVDFPAGAIRGQIPEPGTALLLAAGIGVLASRRQRRPA